MQLIPNKIYVLNPYYRLRNDIHRIALFSKVGTDCNSSKDWHTFIHPIQAVMLSFFTHNRRWEENLRLLSDLFYRDTAYMEKAVSAYIYNSHPIYTVWKGHKIYFPKNVLINVEEAEHPYHFRELEAESFVCRKLDLVTRRFYSGPLLITFMLTNRCLTHCRYCYADTATVVRQMLPTSRILELIREAAGLQVQQVNLIGGEIFLHKDWDVILAELVKHDIAPEYISTKMPLTDELLIQLKRTGYRNLIQVSLDACDKDILQSVLNVRDTYCDEVLQGVQLLDQSGIDYQISSVLTTYNCDRHVLTGLFRFLSTLKHLRDWRIVPVSNSMRVDYKDFARLKPSKTEMEAVFDYMEEFILPAAGFPILLGRELLNNRFYADEGGSNCFNGAACSALNTHMFILPDGKATICEQLYWNPRFIIGDVNHNGLEEVWNSSRAMHLSKLSREDIREKSKCKQCTLFEHCLHAHNRCWTNIIKAYGDDCWDFPDPRCRYAPEMTNNLGY